MTARTRGGSRARGGSGAPARAGTSDPGRKAAASRPRVRRAAVRAGLAALFLLATLAGSAAVVLGADPTASPGAGGDVRTNPTAPGLVGDPLFAVLGVAVVGLVAVVATLAAVRLTARR